MTQLYENSGLAKVAAKILKAHYASDRKESVPVGLLATE